MSWLDWLLSLLVKKPTPVPPGPPPIPVTTTPQPTTTTPQPSPEDAWRSALLIGYNQARIKVNHGILTTSILLQSAAQSHADWMAHSNVMDHTESNGSTVATRVSKVGYAWRGVGENIAFNYRDAASVVSGWIQSPGHYRNMINPAFIEVGFGMARNNNGQPYWCAVLATPGAGILGQFTIESGPLANPSTTGVP